MFAKHVHDFLPKYQRKPLKTLNYKTLPVASHNSKVKIYYLLYKKFNLYGIIFQKGKEAFYEKFGFVLRPNEDLGAGMILYNK